MMSPSPSRFLLPLAVGAALLALSMQAGPFDLISDSERMTAVSSKVYNGYARVRAADGSLRPETYAMGIGGFVRTAVNGLEGGAPPASRDDTIDEIGFGMISSAIEGPLAGQAYVPTTSAAHTDLLIMVFWGRTQGPLGTGNSILGADRDLLDLRNAALLGFDSESVLDPRDFADPTSIMAHIKREVHADVMSALEVDRYCVVLRAFDFQEAWRRKRVRLLWETRFSLSERRHDFGLALPTMAEVASKYFGQDSHGLIQKPPPEGRVEIGVPRPVDEGTAK
jgi:hypothetical protein